MPLQATSGAASYDAFGGGVPVVPQYIEEVFSSYLWTGNGTTQTITNGIDLSGKGGMVWRKQRDATADHFIADTVRGTYSTLSSNTTSAASGSSYIGFLSDGFQAVNSGSSNPSGSLQVGWTFRKQPKFFDVVTWTGDGAGQGVRAIAHGLTSTPGCIIIKRTDSTSEWAVWHRYAGVTNQDLSGISLNGTGAAIGYPNGTTALMNSTSFDPANIYGVNGIGCNINNATYVAYLFAHDAGGFGLTGTDNVISCGSFVSGTNKKMTTPVVLGYEPQWIMFKRSNDTSQWHIIDNMRGLSAAATDYELNANNTNIESNAGYFNINATGFGTDTASLDISSTYIYIAIRRGPMKVPTSGTSVFSPYLYTPTGTNNRTLTGFGFNPDLTLWASRNRASYSDTVAIDRLRGTTGTGGAAGGGLATNTTAAEYGNAVYQISALGSNSVTFGSDSQYGFNNTSINSAILWTFGRAPSFFDEVCYTGTGSAATISHNLGVVPDLIIIKNRGAGGTNWAVNVRSISTNNWVLNLEEDTARFNNALFSSAPTSTTMTFTGAQVNATSNLYVAYLFATCAGVSKCFSYTGNGSSQTINCGFTGGARFVLIKRTDSTGDWYVWDTARGIVSGNDSHLSLNTTAAEVTTDDTIDTDSTGFVVNQVSATNVNVSSATYIGLAIA